PAPLPTLFHYTTLFRSCHARRRFRSSRRRPQSLRRPCLHSLCPIITSSTPHENVHVRLRIVDAGVPATRPEKDLDDLFGREIPQDRKSTRLNSSHVASS